MTSRFQAAVLSAALLLAPLPGLAANPMGYRLLDPQQAAGLPHSRGALGLSVERSQQITDDGMTFDVMRVKQVGRGSAAEQAGLEAGDQVIAVDGWVFPTIGAFAAYVGSVTPGTQVAIDYIPGSGGPQQAQRVMARVAAAGMPAMSTPPGPATAPAPDNQGMSTGTKVAIGLAAVALLGCYERGCFTRKHAPAGAPQQQGGMMQQQPNRMNGMMQQQPNGMAMQPR